MRHRELLIFCFAWLVLLSFPTAMSAQGKKNGVISGKLIDETGSPVVGAVVECAPSDKPDQKKYVTSGAQGAFSLPALPAGSYDLKTTFMGMVPYTATVKLAGAQLDLGSVTMKTDVKQLDETVVKAIAMRTTQKGDTVVYNAGSYKVTSDASTDELLGKMPGIKVDGGTVEAHGEQVKKVLVDGKEFFGEDVTTAIKNLPAEVIDKIEVFDKKSDQAEFSGVDDGEDYKAINIVTRHGIDQAKFGKFYASYGFDDLYNVGMNLNLFKGNRRFSILGMVNNVNQQNFAIDDLLGVMNGGGGRGPGRGGDNFMIGSQNGVSTVKSVGVNYSNQWNEKLKLTASYFFNTSKNTTDALTNRNYFIDQQYNELSDSHTRNFNHRINARLEYKIDDNNTLMFRPNIRFQTNDAVSGDTSATLTGAANGLEGTLLNFLKSLSSTNSTGYNMSGNLIYMHRFGGRAGRVLTASFQGGVSKNDQDNDRYSLTRYYNPDSTSSLNQYITNHSRGYNLNGRVSYSEPITDRMQVLLNYSLSYNYSDRDKRSYEMPGELFLDSLSNTYNSGYLTHRAGPGFRYRSDKTMFIANVNYQYATLTGDQQFPSVARSNMSANFDNVVYFGMLDVKFSRTNKLRAMLRSNTNNPSVAQLQNVLDVSNPLFISQGNPSLRPVYGHNLRLHYMNTNVTKGRTFMVTMRAASQSNYISNSVERADRPGYEVKDENGNTVVVLDQGAQYSRPVNLNGYWSVQGAVNYGTPVKWLASNVNFNLGTSYSALPTILNKVRSTTKTTSYSGGIVIGSNISETFDFTLSYNASYNIAHSSKNNEYFNGIGTARIKWVAWKGITLQADGSYSKYRGVTDQFTEEFLLINASIGKKLFKNERGEVSVRINDMLDRNRGFSRNVTENYIENVTTNTLGRYVSLNFVYNLKTFSGQGGKSYGRPEGDSLPGESRHGMGRPPMGPPPGGGHPPM